ADAGTLFLDEVGDIPVELQPKLLRVLQEHEFERLGSTRTQRVDVRMVAATNRNMEQMVGDKQFREDLYFRLNVFPIRIPPLRETGAVIGGQQGAAARLGLKRTTLLSKMQRLGISRYTKYSSVLLPLLKDVC